MKFKRILSFVASAAMTISALCGAMSITASAAASPTGDCSYEYDSGSRTLTITVTSQEPGATAAMPDYAQSSAPWYRFYNSSIQKVIIGEGVTHIGNYAFYSCTQISDVELPSTLTSIGNYAFNKCPSLNNLTYNETAQTKAPKITTIGTYAFSGCKLGNVPSNFLQSVASLGDSAFSNCANLTSVSMTNRSLTTIPSSAFENSGLTTVTLPSSGLTDIGYHAFTNSKITSISLPSSLTIINQEAFSGCSALASLTLPSNSETKFGTYVFRNCTSLTTVKIPSSYTTVPPYLFVGCKGLQTVIFEGSNVKTIRGCSFKDCTSLTSFDVPGTVTSIEDSAFEGCNQLETISLKHGITTLGSSAFSGCSVLADISLPSTIETLGTGVFQNCAALKSISIPGAVTEIPKSAFSGCANLANVDLPNTVESIGEDAFKDCTSLKSITLPKNLKSVTGQAFAGCTALTAINVPEGSTAFSNPTSSSYSGILLNADKTELIAYPGGLTSSSLTVTSVASTITKIGDYAFYNNPKLSSVTLTSIQEIGNYAFSGSAVTSLTIPNSVVTIGNYAYDGSSKLATLTLTNANVLESVGAYAFRNTKIKEFTLPTSNALKSIGEYAFYGCANLATVTFQSNGVLESIGKNAFYNCSVLTSISIPDTVTSLGTDVFYGCAAMTSATIGKGLTVVPVDTFRNCTELKSVTIPSTVTEVGNYAFAACSNLVDVEIPNSVTTLGTYVFQNCASLKKAVIGNKITTIPTFTFSGCTNPDLAIYLLGTISTITAANSFGNNASSYVKGTIYVFDDTSYTTLLNANPVKTAGYATLKYGANFTNLYDLIAKAKEYIAIDYTDASYSVLASALTFSEITIADYAATQGRVDAAVASMRSAIDGLVKADNTEWLNKLAEAVERAKSYVRSDYRTNTFSNLRTAYLAGEEVTGDELNSELEPLIKAIEEAEKNLVLNYAYSDPVMTVKSGPHSNDYQYKYAIMEGIATEAVDGATQARITFDCASHVKFTGINFKSYITRSDDTAPKGFIEFNDDSKEKKAGIADTVPPSAQTEGETGLKATFDLAEPLMVGDAYHIYTYTRLWGDKPEYAQYDYAVFHIREVELLDAEGNVLLSTKDVVIPNEDLLAAIDEAEAADTTGASAESVQALNDAVAAANKILEQELPLPSAMDSAAQAIRDAIKALGGAVEPSVDKTALNEEIKNADDMDKSTYTDESVAALKSAIDSAKTVAANESATKEEVDAAVKAIKDAVAALKPKSDSSSNPPDSSNSSNSSNGGSTSTTVAPATTANPAVRAAKDKADAQKLMNQAKITKLTVKSKAKKKITVNWNKVSKAKGYQVQVSKKSNFKKKSIFFNKFTSKKKLTVTKKLKSGKTYYVRVRAYATYKDANNATKKVYSKWNKKLRKVKVK